MGAIAGIFRRDGAPVGRADLERLTACVPHRGPDGVGHWVERNVGMGSCALWTTPEAEGEALPLVNSEAGLVLAWHGRLDNRKELSDALELEGADARVASDSELVLRAYETWGDDCPKRLLGPFAFAIWDRPRQRLFCARDFLGLRPFCYHLTDRLFVFGTEIRQILETPGLERVPNEGMVMEHLTHQITTLDETLLLSVRRLPPAHWMSITAGDESFGVFWRPPGRPTIFYDSDGEYAEHFRKIFMEAVTRRLRSHNGKVGAYLSGGLDSSCVVGAAHPLIQAEHAQVSDFQTFSLVFPEQPEADESSYIREVIRHLNLSANLVEPSPPGGHRYQQQTEAYLDLPDTPNGVMLDRLLERARAAGFRVLLTGQGGDEWLKGNTYTRLGPVGRLLRMRQDRGLYLALLSACWQVTGGMLPPGRRAGLRNVLAMEMPAWIQRGFRRRAHLRQRLARVPLVLGGIGHAASPSTLMLAHGQLVHRREVQERYAASFGIEERHPYHDRHLVEFALSIPFSRLARPGADRLLQRTGMEGLVPDRVLQRRSKADFSYVFPRDLERASADRLWRSGQLARRDWVAPTPLARDYERMLRRYHNGDPRYPELMCYVWPAYCLELWARTVLA